VVRGERNEIMRNKHKLKGGGFLLKMIWEENWRGLTNGLRSRRGGGKEKGGKKKIKVRLDKVRIGNIWKAWNIIKKKDEEKRKNKVGKENEETKANKGKGGEARGIRTGNQNQKQNFALAKKD